MDVVVPLLVLSVPLIALLWYGIRWALRHDRKRPTKRDRAKQELIDAEFEALIESVRKKRDE